MILQKSLLFKRKFIESLAREKKAILCLGFCLFFLPLSVLLRLFALTIFIFASSGLPKGGKRNANIHVSNLKDENFLLKMKLVAAAVTFYVVNHMG